MVETEFPYWHEILKGLQEKNEAKLGEFILTIGNIIQKIEEKVQKQEQCAK